MDELRPPIRSVAALAGMLFGLGAWLVFLDSFVSNRDGHLHVPPLAKPLLVIAGVLVVNVVWNALPLRERRNR